MLRIFTTPQKKQRIKLNLNSIVNIEFVFCILIVVLLLAAVRFAIYAIQDITGNEFYNSMSQPSKIRFWGTVSCIIFFAVVGVWIHFPVTHGKKKSDKFEAWAYYRGILYYFMIMMPTKYHMPMEFLDMQRADLNDTGIKPDDEILRSEYEVREFFKDEYRMTQFLDGKIRCNCIFPAEVSDVKVISEDKKGMKVYIWGKSEKFIRSDMTDYESLAEIIKSKTGGN